MVNKVNGIKIYAKHSLGSVLSASFFVFCGLLIFFGLTFFPILSATVNDSVMRSNGVDYLSDVLDNSALSGANFLPSLVGITHFLNPTKYNHELFDVLGNFKNSASNVENLAVSWYGSAYAIFDNIMAISYALLMICALFMLVEGIIRLATGTYPKFSKIFVVIAFVLMALFSISLFLTNFCLKYVALEVLGLEETYVANACPLPYIIWCLTLAIWIAEYWVNAILIKGKLYVADARLMKEPKESKKDVKGSKKVQKEEVAPTEEASIEETNITSEAVSEQTNVEESPKQEETTPVEETKLESNKEEPKKPE